MSVWTIEQVRTLGLQFPIPDALLKAFLQVKDYEGLLRYVQGERDEQLCFVLGEEIVGIAGGFVEFETLVNQRDLSECEVYAIPIDLGSLRTIEILNLPARVLEGLTQSEVSLIKGGIEIDCIGLLNALVLDPVYRSIVGSGSFSCKVLLAKRQRFYGFVSSYHGAKLAVEFAR